MKDHGVPVAGPFHFDHVAFSVESDDALWELKERLEAADFWVSEVMDHGFIHSIYTFDPNHIPIEFSAPVAGMDLRQNPKMADPHPPPAGREGPQPQPWRWPSPLHKTPESEKIIFPGEGIALTELGDGNSK